MMSEYRERIAVLEENFKLFKKSVETCDLSAMLGHNTLFMETLKNANEQFGSMSSTSKKQEDDAFRKSQFLTQEYIKMVARINSQCICR